MGLVHAMHSNGPLLQVKATLHQLEDIRVNILDEDIIFTYTMGLNKSYDSFIISLDTTPAKQLTLDVISSLLNEEIHHDNVQAHSLVMKLKRRARLGLRKKKMLCLQQLTETDQQSAGIAEGLDTLRHFALQNLSMGRDLAK